MLREERTELICLLATLQEQMKISTRPEMFITAIRQTRRKLLGMYRQAMNTQKPVDKVELTGDIGVSLESGETHEASLTSVSENEHNISHPNVSIPAKEINRDSRL